MESLEANSHLTNQHSHSHSLSDPSLDNDVNLVHVLALELETLVLDYVKNEEFGQDLKRGSFNDEIKSGSLIESGKMYDLDVGLENLDGNKNVLEEGFEKVGGFDDQDTESWNVSGKKSDFDGNKNVLEDGVEKVRVFEVQENESCDDFDVAKNVQEESLEKVGGFDDQESESWNDYDGGKNVLEDGVEVMDGGYGEDNGEYEGVDDGGYGGYGDDDDDGWGSGLGSGDNDDGGMKSYHYPLRPDAEDCSYYVRTGMCKFGLSCKFNHPLKKRNQPYKETRKQKEENFERNGQQIECKYFLSSAGCKYGKACKYSHTRGKPGLTPVLEYNFLGLPVRPGEKECPYYMRNGSCKYGPNCRFNHPDPTAVGGADGPMTYGNGGSLPIQTAPEPSMPSWSAPRTPDPAASFVPMMYSPPQNMPPPNTDWNGFQAPALPHVYPSSEQGLPIPPAFFLNNPPTDTNLYTHHQQPMPVFEYPERPGQPDCSFYMKTGDCKYKVSCKFNHPRNRITKNSPSVFSDKGLPLRPDQIVCTHYSRYGICKYGPACKYDHPLNYSNSSPARQGYLPGGSDGSLIQQSV